MKAAWLLAAALLAVGVPARAAELFNLDQRHGSIGFSVRQFGAFASMGSFARFAGRLLIDPRHPELSKIDVQADAASVTVPWPDSAALLRGPAFFDAARYPDVRFTSSAVHGIDASHFLVAGTLEIRGVRRPVTLDATVRQARANPGDGAEIADFRITGTLSRSAFGMTADPIVISDQVKLLIAARVELPARDR